MTTGPVLEVLKETRSIVPEDITVPEETSNTKKKLISSSSPPEKINITPIDIEDQLPVIPDGVEVIELPEELQRSLFGDIGEEFEIADEEQEIEKGLISVVGKVLAFFRGLFGRWVTVGGRPIFIKLKGLFSSEVSVREARTAATAFKRLPRNMRVGLGNVKVSNRNIVERLLPQKTPPFLVGKKLFRVSKMTHKQTLAFSFPKSSGIITRTLKVRGPAGITAQTTKGFLNTQRKFVSLPDDAVEASTFYRGPGYTTVVKGKRKFIPFFDGPKQTTIVTPKLTIWPGRLRALGALKKGGKRSAQLGIADVVNRSGGRSIFPTAGTKVTEGMEFNLSRFGQVTTKEGGVTTYAERLRRQLIRGQGKTIERDGAIENFGELFMLFKRRNSKFRGQWNALQKTHPETINRFFTLMELFGIT